MAHIASRRRRAMHRIILAKQEERMTAENLKRCEDRVTRLNQLLDMLGNQKSGQASSQSSK